MSKKKIREILATVKILIPEDSPSNQLKDDEILETLRAKSTIADIKVQCIEKPEE